MPELIPFDSVTAAELEGKIAESKFKTTESFIDFYNSGLINKSAPEVVDFAADVDRTFKNVRLQGKSLVFISINEVYMAEITERLTMWETLVKIKRGVSDLVRGGSIARDTTLVFTPGAVGVIQKVADGEPGQAELEKLSEEKFFRSQEMMMAIAREHFDYGDAEGDVLLEASRILDLEDDFIPEIHNLLF